MNKFMPHTKGSPVVVSTAPAAPPHAGRRGGRGGAANRDVLALLGDLSTWADITAVDGLRCRGARAGAAFAVTAVGGAACRRTCRALQQRENNNPSHTRHCGGRACTLTAARDQSTSCPVDTNLLDAVIEPQL